MLWEWVIILSSSAILITFYLFNVVKRKSDLRKFIEEEKLQVFGYVIINARKLLSRNMFVITPFAIIELEKGKKMRVIPPEQIESVRCIRPIIGRFELTFKDQSKETFIAHEAVVNLDDLGQQLTDKSIVSINNILSIPSRTSLGNYQRDRHNKYTENMFKEIGLKTISHASKI